ncbi:MAG: DegT/DnrJ/EryC1/StrS family aminotransferase [Elusimicrobiota bacterium]
MKVPYSYLVDQFARPEKILEAIKNQLKKCDFTLGAEVEEFEKKFAVLCGTKYAVGVNSGTDALFLSLKTAGVMPGDEVITAPDTFIATVGAIVAAGARPVFVDVQDDYNIDVSKIESAITQKTKVIMPVHYSGNPADMPEIMKIAGKHNLLVIEDACQAIGAKINDKPVGTFGLAAGYSLHPLKNLNVWGDAGLAITDSEEIRNKLILLRNHGLKNRDEIEIFGYNSRLDTIQAIVGLHLIDQVEDITIKRIRNAQKYDDAFANLKEFIAIPPRDKRFKNVFHIYIIQVEKRDELLLYLIKNEIEAKIHYPIPLHLQEASKQFGYKKGDFPVAEKQAESIISLPVHQHLSPQQVEYVIGKVREFYGKGAYNEP